jgi:hypothetical protein
MFNIEKINLNFAYPSFYFIITAVIIAFYAFYIYRYTIPQINQLFKLFLIALRTTALFLILFAIFEPILNIVQKKIIEPINLIFIDNSKSIQIQDGTNRKETILKFLNEAENNGLYKNSELFDFGGRVTKIDPDSIDKLTFSETSTNFSKIFSSFKNEENNISSIVIISDGVITDGTNPIYTAEKAGIPVFTVGIGDTTKRKNLAVSKILSNEYIYAETPTTINVSVSNNGFENRSITLNLYEDNRFLEKQSINLTNENEKTTSIIYTPKSPGEKKLTFTISELKGEFSFADNKKIVYVKVLDNKINVLLLAGSPSADLSFIKNSLASDEYLRIHSIVQIAPDRFLENTDRNKLIDSTNVLYLIGFPSSQTPNSLLNKVLEAIKSRNKPFFLITSSGIDYNKLKLFQSELPFTIKSVTQGSTEVQPDVSADEMENPLLENNAQNIIDAWDNLPPVISDNVEYNIKPESQVLAKIRINNIPFDKPLIISRKLGSQKSIALLAKNIWKWKLQTAEKKLDLFDRFIISSVKWLNTKEDQKLVSIKTTKKIYSFGEPVEFTGQVYDETLNPVDDAEINVDVKSENEDFSVIMNAVGSGIYEGKLETNKSGDYTYSGTAKLRGKVLGSDKGKFSIGEVDIEMINPRMDKDFLNLLSLQTGGKFFYYTNYSQLFKMLKNLDEKKSNVKLVKSEYTLWSSEWLLLSAIILLGLEWFFRKRSGML